MLLLNLIALKIVGAALAIDFCLAEGFDVFIHEKDQ